MIILKIDKNNILASICSQLENNNHIQEVKDVLEGNLARFVFSYCFITKSKGEITSGQKNFVEHIGYLNDDLEICFLNHKILNITRALMKKDFGYSHKYIQDLTVTIELIK